MMAKAESRGFGRSARRRCGAFAALLVAVLAVAGCETAPPESAFPEITFRNNAPIALDVARIETVNNYRASTVPPNVAHLFPRVPSDVALRWPGDRLEAVGNRGYARFILRQASAVESALPTQGGVQGTFTNEQSERYDVRVIVDLEIFDGFGQQVGLATASADHWITVAEDASVTERERAWFSLTEAVMQNLDAELDRTIRRDLAPFVVR